MEQNFFLLNWLGSGKRMKETVRRKAMFFFCLIKALQDAKHFSTKIVWSALLLLLTLRNSLKCTEKARNETSCWVFWVFLSSWIEISHELFFSLVLISKVHYTIMPTFMDNHKQNNLDRFHFYYLCRQHLCSNWIVFLLLKFDL